LPPVLATVKAMRLSAAGCAPCRSVMRAARMSKRQASPATSAVLVDSFTLRPLAGKVSGTLPEVPQLRAKAPLARFTVSLNTTSRSAAAGKVLLPCAGVVVDTDGGVFGPGFRRR
jgi:hypothetical protein